MTEICQKSAADTFISTHRFSLSLIWLFLLLPLLSCLAGKAEDTLPVPSHIEFVSQWFPESANSATHIKVSRAAQLATTAKSTPAQFGSVLDVLNQIRHHTGLDPSLIESYTIATVTIDAPGSITFFSTNQTLELEQHFASGQFPISPEVHRFHNHIIYELKSDDRSLGLYGLDRKNFILGDWATFKHTMLGNEGNLNEIAKILADHEAPVIICTNPRRNEKRSNKDDPFGTVISLDFESTLLAFLMKEEHPTPEIAAARHADLEATMPQAFESAYGMQTKQGVRFLAQVDGRHVTFAAQSPISAAGKLLDHMLKPVVEIDHHADLMAKVTKTIKLFQAATAAGAPVANLPSTDSIVAALCVGLDGQKGERFQLPFMTGIEQEAIASKLALDGSTLSMTAEEPPEIETISVDEKQIRRHAQTIATLTMSAAAVDSPELKNLKTTEEIVKILCSSGLTSGPAHRKAEFKGPELSPQDVERVSQYLAPSDGYLVYLAN